MNHGFDTSCILNDMGQRFTTSMSVATRQSCNAWTSVVLNRREIVAVYLHLPHYIHQMFVSLEHCGLDALDRRYEQG